VPKFQHHKKLRSKSSTLLVSSLNLSSVWCWKSVFFLLNVTFSLSILEVIPRVHLASFVIMLPNHFKIPYSILFLVCHNL
jgi:hypothetical protein